MRSVINDAVYERQAERRVATCGGAPLNTRIVDNLPSGEDMLLQAHEAHEAHEALDVLDQTEPRLAS